MEARREAARRMSGYAIRFTKHAEDDAVCLDAAVLFRIHTAIETKLAVDPERFGKPLRHALRGLRALRVGDWRIIFKIEPNNIIVVLSVRHRGKGYGDFGV